MNLWDFLWWMLWVYLFFAYLWVLFTIFRDLFRDRHLNGWWKAVWIFFLIFAPFITALIYVIARGRGMAERSMQSQLATQQATTSYIKEVAGSGKGPSDEIAAAAALLAAGTITQQEFDQLKAKALAG
jgi:hypothetical protein